MEAVPGTDPTDPFAELARCLGHDPLFMAALGSTPVMKGQGAGFLRVQIPAIYRKIAREEADKPRRYHRTSEGTAAKDYLGILSEMMLLHLAGWCVDWDGTEPCGWDAITTLGTVDLKCARKHPLYFRMRSSEDGYLAPADWFWLCYMHRPDTMIFGPMVRREDVLEHFNHEITSHVNTDGTPVYWWSLKINMKRSFLFHWPAIGLNMLGPCACQSCLDRITIDQAFRFA